MKSIKGFSFELVRKSFKVNIGSIKPFSNAQAYSALLPYNAQLEIPLLKDNAFKGERLNLRSPGNRYLIWYLKKGPDSLLNPSQVSIIFLDYFVICLLLCDKSIWKYVKQSITIERI